MSKAFADCKGLPPDQSCDALANSTAKVSRWWGGWPVHGWCPEPASCCAATHGAVCVVTRPLFLQSVATSVATAIAQTAGSVKGGPGCVGQANASASAQVGGDVLAGWVGNSGDEQGCCHRTIGACLSGDRLLAGIVLTNYHSLFLSLPSTAICSSLPAARPQHSLKHTPR